MKGIIVKLKLVNGNIEMFETENYVVSKVKEMHPDILDVKVYTTSGKLIAHRRRWRQRFYKKYLYKPVSVELKPDAESAPIPEA
jgi:hypothetical protein